MSDSTPNMTSEQFREAKLSLGWSASKASEKLGVTTRSVRRYMSGDAPVPLPVAHLIKIHLQAEAVYRQG